MHGRYGMQWTRMWANGEQTPEGDAGMQNALAVWGEELAGFASRPECLGYALEAWAGEFPPTLPQFLELCRTHARRVSADAKRIELKQTDEEREQAKRTADKIANAFGGRTGFDPLLWAKRPASDYAVRAIVAEAKAGNLVLLAILTDLVERGVVTPEGKLSKKAHS